MISVNTSAKLVRDLQFSALGCRETDFSNGCERPFEVRLRGLPDRVTVGFRIERDAVAVHTILAPCRRCNTCLRNRAKRWAAKAHTEMSAATRTWFCTMTVAPQHRLIHKLNAQVRATERGSPWETLSDAERFVYIHHEVGAECTKWIKRIRKNSGAKLRYLLVSEAHKDGFPHFHALVHEYEKPVLWKTLDAGWRQGFGRFKVDVSDETHWYVCKYIAKSALTRIRASQHYGPRAGSLLSERVLHATRDVLYTTRSIPPCQ